MYDTSSKKLILTACLAFLSACGNESPTAIESSMETGSTSLSTDARPLARAMASPVASLAAGKFRKSTDAIPGQYIVVLKDSELGTAKVPELAQRLTLPQRATVTRTYEHALRGFVVQTSEEGARALAARPEVDFVEEDGRVFLDEPQDSVRPLAENSQASFSGTQTGGPWGLDRIDQINLPLNNTYNFPRAGTGVNVYIIDTGILTSHPDFGGRASADFTVINDGRGAIDCNGHGTHVAGTVGGYNMGVAKDVRLHSVRVADCNGNGSASTIMAGVDWVTANKVRPAVANMSVGWTISTALDTAVRNSIASGVVYVVAAGNNNADACNGSPGRVAEAITVGATTNTDNRASFSNYGTCVDIFAPGVDIVSDYVSNGSAAYAQASGTSMAAPHVAGAAALYLENNPNAAPATVATAVVFASPANKVGNAGSGSSTRLLHSTPLKSCSVLGNGDALSPGQMLYSCNGKAALVHQTDGNVVVYDRLGALWHTQTGGQTTSNFIMQTDGNLVLYTGAGSPLWYTLGNGNAGAFLAIQDDCNLVLYSPGGTPLWATYTTCR